MERLKAIYETYIEAVARVYQDARPMDGVFGWGEDPRKDPCHMRFYGDAELWCRTFAAEEPAQEAVYEAVRFMLEVPAAHRGKNSFWFLYAAQGLTRELIPRLSGAQCAELRQLYDGAYPRRDRMPAQKEVYRLLKKGASRQ